MKKPNHYILDLQMFAEDQTAEQPKEEVDPNKNAVEALKKLQENSVPKDKYEALEKQNKELWETAINGGGKSKGTPQKATIEDLREELYGSKRHPMTNLEYWTKTMDLRDMVMESGAVDPMVPSGNKVQATANDFLVADNIAKTMKELIKQADGDPDLFNSLLTRAGLDKIKK